MGEMWAGLLGSVVGSWVQVCSYLHVARGSWWVVCGGDVCVCVSGLLGASQC